MKVTLESTNKIVELKTPSGVIPARLWEGTTESGIPCHAFITRIAVHKDDDSSQFERELQEQVLTTRSGHRRRSAGPSRATAYRLVTTTAAGIVFPGIQCLLCLRTSWNRHDIDLRYCGACHRFHDDPELPRGTSQTGAVSQT